MRFRGELLAKFKKEGKMKPAIYLASVIILLSGQMAWGEGLGPDASKLGKLEAGFLAQNSPSLQQRVKTSLAGQQSVERKSIQKAFLLSAILPGVGEYYMGSKTRMILFGGIEVLSWTGYLTYHHKGKVKEKEFQRFANDEQNWNLYDYLDFVNDQFLDGTNYHDKYYPDVYDPADWDSIQNHLPDAFIHDVLDAWSHDRQQYYEMIGKYYNSQFGPGWQDSKRTSDSLYCWYSDNAETYMDMRGLSNKFLKRAKWGVGAALVNRVLSAFDAALLAKSHNKRADRFSGFSLRAEVIDYCGEPTPHLILTKRF